VTADDTAYEVQWANPALIALGWLSEKVATAVIGFVYTSVAENPRVGHPRRFELDERATIMIDRRCGTRSGTRLYGRCRSPRRLAPTGHLRGGISAFSVGG
jgi:hypothetical protein